MVCNKLGSFHLQNLHKIGCCNYNRDLNEIDLRDVFCGQLFFFTLQFKHSLKQSAEKGLFFGLFTKIKTNYHKVWWL